MYLIFPIYLRFLAYTVFMNTLFAFMHKNTTAVEKNHCAAFFFIKQ